MPDAGFLILVYFETIKLNNGGVQLNEVTKARMKKCIKLALDLMGDEYEIC